jgi:hypothetical protein
MARESFTRHAHEQLHKLPGMPEHSEASRLNHRGGLPNRPFQNRSLKTPRTNHGHREPKVLVGWQNAIARFFSRGSK